MSDNEKAENFQDPSFHLDTLQEGVLALGMYQEKTDATTSYQIDPDGMKRIPALDDINSGMLAEKFKHDPKDLLALGRQNIFSIMKDPRLPKADKVDRVKRYLEAFFSLQLKLDHASFPPDQTVRSGVPEYIPDGLTDMGSDPNPDPTYRSREKIRINKREILNQAKGLFLEIFTAEYGTEVTSDRLKNYIIKKTAQFVYTSMPYDYQNADPFPNMGRSVLLVESFDRKLAVCRHHALCTQVLLQAFGITSRLLKCNVSFGEGNGGAHACNLVRVNGKWSILDSTNPDEDNGAREVFLAPIPDTDIDINKHDYTWQIPRKREKATWTIKSRHNMFYKYSGYKKP